MKNFRFGQCVLDAFIHVHCTVLYIRALYQTCSCRDGSHGVKMESRAARRQTPRWTGRRPRCCSAPAAVSRASDCPLIERLRAPCHATHCRVGQKWNSAMWQSSETVGRRLPGDLNLSTRTHSSAPSTKATAASSGRAPLAFLHTCRLPLPAEAFGWTHLRRTIVTPLISLQTQSAAQRRTPTPPIAFQTTQVVRHNSKYKSIHVLYCTVKIL